MGYHAYDLQGIDAAARLLAVASRPLVPPGPLRASLPMRMPVTDSSAETP